MLEPKINVQKIYSLNTERSKLIRDKQNLKSKRKKHLYRRYTKVEENGMNNLLIEAKKILNIFT